MNKKIIVLIVLVLIGLIGYGSYVVVKNNTTSSTVESFTSADLATRAYINYIKDQKFNQAYGTIKNNQLDKDQFKNYMSTIQLSVSLDKCEFNTLNDENNQAKDSVQTIEVLCPYKDPQLNKTLRIIFSSENQTDGKVILTSYDISYI